MSKLSALIVLTLFVQSGTIFNQSNKPESDYFKVEVLQNGKIVEEENGIIKLEKKPFTYQLTFYKVTGVDVSNSWGKYYYDYPNHKNIYECNDDRFFKDCRFVAIKTGSEDKFNENKDIYVGDGGYQQHWSYDEGRDWHRLDKGVKVENGVIHAEVTVENIYDLDKRDSRDFNEDEYNYPVEKINQKIYAVFAASHYESGMKQPEELQREKIILKFN